MPTKPVKLTRCYLTQWISKLVICNKGHVSIWNQHKFKSNLYVGPVNVFLLFGTATTSHSNTRDIASTLASPVLLQGDISRICYERILPFSAFHLSTWNQLAVISCKAKFSVVCSVPQPYTWILPEENNWVFPKYWYKYQYMNQADKNHKEVQV